MSIEFKQMVAETRTAMAKKTDAQEAKDISVGKNELADALVQAIEAAKPKRVTAANRKPDTPWHPRDERVTLKFKRKMYQHGIPLSESRHNNETIELLNKIKPGTYCDGFVKVIRRKDKGLNIDYPVKTASQRLKLTNQFGITSLADLARRIIDESNDPVKYNPPDEYDE